MEELSIEQKARAYDKAVEMAKSWYIDAQIDFKKSLENLFPELMESKGERIKKVIYGWIYTQSSQFFDNGFSKEEMLAWVEKQGEHNSIWSEEDEERLQSCLNILQAKGIMGVTETVNTKWLKSLKDRYTWKPSEEQIKALNNLNLTRGLSYVGQGQELINLYNDLKKLKG